MPDSDRASSLLGVPLFAETRDDTSPTGSWCLRVGAGLGARPSFLFSCGVSPPHDEVLLFRQKDPKPVAPGRGPQEGVPAPRSLVCGLRNSLRSDSPRRHMEGTGPGRSPARRRREAFLSCPALSCWHSCSLLLSSPTPPAVIPDPDRGSRVFVFSLRFIRGRRKALDSRVRGNDRKRARGSNLLSCPA